jgi:hypothetical protein
MPLEKAKPGTPGFSRNIATEIKAGKPQRQAVAIAYRMSGERQDAGERFVAKRLWDNGPWACYDTKKNVEAGRFQYKNDAVKKAAQMNASRSDADPAYERNVAETKKTFPNVKHFTSEGHPDWKKHGVKDAANASPIYEENGEFFFPKPGSRERFGPYASKAEATNAAANAGVISDADPCFKNFEMVGMKEKGGKPVPNCVPMADEAILGRKDAASTIRQEGDEWVITSDTNGSKSVIRLDVKDYSRSEALEYATSLPQYTYGKFNVQADALPALNRALAAADSLYSKALDAAHRSDAERDLPGASTTEGNYGIDSRKDAWDESAHPRGEDGKFGSGGGSSKSSEGRPKGWWIEAGGKTIPIANNSDAAMEKALKKAGLIGKDGEWPEFEYGKGEESHGGG